MSAYTIRLQMPNYLAEWFVNEHGGNQPVNLIRDSAESNLVQAFLRQRPSDCQDPAEYNVVVNIPTYKTLDVRTYNYLPPEATALLKSCIYNNFKVNLWKELHRIENCNVEIGQLILAYMEKHRISGVRHSENWEAIRQSYYRIRKKYSLTRKNKTVKECEIEFEN